MTEEVRSSTTLFVEGATKPSLLALAITLCIPLVAALSFVVVVTPKWYAHSYGFFMDDERAFDAYTSGRALALSHTPAKSQRLVILGGSVPREALVGEEVLSDLMGSALNDSVEVFKLCSAAITTWQMLGFAGQTPENFRGTIVIDMSINRLSRPFEDQSGLNRLAFTSDEVEKELKQSGFASRTRTGINVVDNRAFYLPRIRTFAQRLIKGPVLTVATNYPEGKVQTQSEWATRADHIRKVRDQFDNNSTANFDASRRMISELRRKGATIVFLKPPINPRFLEDELDGDQYENQVLTVEKFAAEIEAPVIDLERVVELSEEDFYDWAHISSVSARERFSNEFVKELAKIIQGKEAGGE